MMFLVVCKSAISQLKHLPYTFDNMYIVVKVAQQPQELLTYNR